MLRLLARRPRLLSPQRLPRDLGAWPRRPNKIRHPLGEKEEQVVLDDKDVGNSSICSGSKKTKSKKRTTSLSCTARLVKEISPVSFSHRMIYSNDRHPRVRSVGNVPGNHEHDMVDFWNSSLASEQ